MCVEGACGEGVCGGKVLVGHAYDVLCRCHYAGIPILYTQPFLKAVCTRKARASHQSQPQATHNQRTQYGGLSLLGTGAPQG